jgi:hypothetical protein
MTPSQIARLKKKGAILPPPEPEAPPPAAHPGAESMQGCADAMRECAQATGKQSEEVAKAMRQISEAMANRVSYKFTVKRTEAGLIESVIARPLTLLGE